MHDLLVVTQRMADDELLDGARTLVARERRLTAELVAHLAEIDSRGLALRAGYPSLFMYAAMRSGSRSTRPTAASRRPGPRGGSR